MQYTVTQTHRVLCSPVLSQAHRSDGICEILTETFYVLNNV